MLSKEQIILQFYNSPNPMQICKKISHQYYTDDLLHECILTLYDLDENKILDAYNNNYLTYLFYKIVYNSYISYTSPFAKKYKHFEFNTNNFNKIKTESDFESSDFENENEKFTKDIENSIEELEEYDRELFKLYIQFGDFRKISNLVDIKYGAVRHSILQTINYLKTKHNEQFNNLHFDWFGRLCDEPNNDRDLEEEI
jgi:hypothetical protein